MKQLLARGAVALIALCIGLLPIAAAVSDTPTLDVPSTALHAPASENDMLCSASDVRPGRQAGPVLVSQLADGQVAQFRSDYDPANWGAGFWRYAMAVGTDGAVASGAPWWNAGTILTGDAGMAAQPAPAARSIYAGVIQTAGSVATIAFDWNALPADVRAAWSRDPLAPSAVDDDLGEARVRYLRGERDMERSQPDGVFRSRTSILGDSVHAMPLLVGAPSVSIGGASYALFNTRYGNRRPAVYLGANDGMLHAFDATNGSELFAYIPAALLAGLADLTSTSYVHRAYVDGNAVAGEAVTASGWRTVLVSGMGMGAQGVFALDVSDPAHFADGLRALWEFTDRDDPAMGNVLAAPAIAMLKTGTGQYRHFALVASGINNYRDDGAGRFSPDASGVLFLLALDKPASAPWILGSNYFKLATPVSESGRENALGPPVVVSNADGSARFAYAGDLQGNLWRFDFSGRPPWSRAPGPGAGPTPLFVARDGAGLRQPITEQPRAAFAPGGGYLILFGTGKYLEAGDLNASSFSPQSFYAIRDPGLPTGAASGPAIVQGRSELAERHLSSTADSGTAFHVAGADFSYAGADAKKGWYLDFLDSGTSGERSVSSPAVSAGALVFATLLPSVSCADPDSRSYLLDVLTGLSIGPKRYTLGGVTGQLTHQIVPGPSMLIALNASIGASTPTGQATLTRTLLVVQPRDDGSTSTTPLTVKLPAKRLSWREIANWQTLHRAATE